MPIPGLREDERRILAQMRDGWRPFVTQLGSVATRLLGRGLIEVESGEMGRDRYRLTDAGRAKRVEPSMGRRHAHDGR